MVHTHSPQMSGTHVTGFVSCTLIFQMSVSSAAPFMPSIWRAAAEPSPGAAFLLAVSASACLLLASRRSWRLQPAAGAIGGRTTA